MRKDITRAEQLEKRKNWRDASVDAVVATVIFKREYNNSEPKFLVVERLRGAEKGKFQAHHGGFLTITDQDIYSGAIREVLEETSYFLEETDLRYFTSIGPAIYRSDLTLKKIKEDVVLILTISNEEAEPNVAFALPLFTTDVTKKDSGVKTDGEVSKGRWMTIYEIIEEFGGKEKFNYFQILLAAYEFINENWYPGKRAMFKPGEYTYPL